MDIEEKIFPNSNKLLNYNGNLSALIIDMELDPIRCKFNNDGGVKINTKNINFISLSRDNLIQLLNLIHESEIEYKKINK
tara:strand:- start:252 stop:491 length:240 start_codon:yes stop_codon:yes gene_type:complete